MGKDRKRKREINELKKRLLELEKRMRRKHHDYSDDYETLSSGSQSPHHRRKETPRRQRRTSVTPDTEEDRKSDSQHRERERGTDIDTNTSQHIPLEPPLPANIEELLGEEGTLSPNSPITIHDGLARRWTTIIQNGLREDSRVNILKKYDTPNNLPLLKPPKLNEEIVAAINDSGIKRDKRIGEQQVALGAAITCIGKVLNNLISLENEENIQVLSDSGRLLCDLFHNNCMTRRSLILPGLNKDMKELMENTPISEYLFGDKLQDKVNAIKAVKKSAQEMKNTPPQAKPPMKQAQKKTSEAHNGRKRLVTVGRNKPRR